jgi:hypothetical protein
MVGVMSVSTDVYFHAVEYKVSLERWKKQKKARDEMLKKKTTEEKAKAIDVSKVLTMDSLKKLLKWKLMDEEYKDLLSGSKRKPELEALWLCFKDRVVPDVQVLIEEPEPDVPLIEETELGCSAKNLCDATLAQTMSLKDDELQMMMKDLIKTCQERGIQVEEV